MPVRQRGRGNYYGNVPVRYNLSDNGRIDVRATDPVLITEVIDTFSTMAGDARMRSGMRMCIDARGVATLPERGSGNPMVAMRVLRTTGVERVAIVTDDDALAQLASGVAGSVEGVTVAVFRDAGAASHWLDEPERRS